MAVKARATLPDRPPHPGGVLLIGINPAPVSVRAGHYYQGRLGQRLWARLRSVGLLDDEGHQWEDDAFVAAGNGLTDIVKRPTASAADVSPRELADGADVLSRKIRKWAPGLLLFAFRPPAEALFGRDVRPGVVGGFESVPGFLPSGPYAPATEQLKIDGELRKSLRKIQRSGRLASIANASSPRPTVTARASGNQPATGSPNGCTASHAIERT
jgi:TDG/mug DNA glycosylase family protein